MTAFLAGQSDYVYFLYGLAFMLLGSVCFSWLREGQFPWFLLAGAAFTHGAGDWLELVALLNGDSRPFEILRALVFGCSFLALVEFARQSNRRFLGWAPGPWLHILLGAGALLLALPHGLPALGPAVRFVMATTGAVWSGLLFLGLSFRPDDSREGPAARSALRSAGLALCAYGLTSGLFGPAAPFFPADRMNQEAFLAATGLPIQIVRGLVAGWLTVSVWAYAESLDREGRVRRKRRIAFWLMSSAIAAILAGGWLLTSWLGGLRERDIAQRAEADAKAVEDHLLDEMRATDQLVRGFSASAGRLRLLGPGGRIDRRGLDFHVDDLVGSTRDRIAFILDATGLCISTSNRGRPDSFLGQDHSAWPYFRDAMQGGPGRSLGFGSDSRQPGYYASGPIRGADEVPAGALVVEWVPSAAELGLGRPGTFRLVSNDGRVPGSGIARLHPGGRSQVTVSRPLPEAGGSLVLSREERGRTAYRLLGIAITLLFCALVMAYFVAMQRQYGTESRLSRNQGVLEGLTRHLRRRADLDALTGVRNRLAFDAVLAAEVERARRQERPLSIVMVDLDHFKRVNDEYGHQAGDEVLVRTARLMKRIIRRSDTVARWGGEEFMVVSPRTPLEGALQQAEKIRGAILARPPGSACRVTASFGVASLRPEDTVEELLRRADEALYRAKSAGRDRVESEAA